jgi:hypothetical protein
VIVAPAADYPTVAEEKTQQKSISEGLEKLSFGWCWSPFQQCSLMIIECVRVMASGERAEKTVSAYP